MKGLGKEKFYTKAKTNSTVGNCCLQYDASELEQVKVAVGEKIIGGRGVTVE